MKIGNQIKEMGIALETIIKEIYQLVLLNNMPSKQKGFIINRIGDVEYRLSLGCQEKTCLASLIGAFIEIRHIN